jgi:LEA14-like dessication related protein
MRQLGKWLGCLLLAGCSTLPLSALAPKVSVASIDIKSLGLFEQRFDLGLRLTNPNDFDLKIEGLDFDLEVNGRPFAKGLCNTVTMIPAASSTTMHVEAITESKNIISQARTMPFETLKQGVPYRVKGRVKTDRTDWLPFEHNGTYGGDNRPRGQET